MLNAGFRRKKVTGLFSHRTKLGSRSVVSVILSGRARFSTLRARSFRQVSGYKTGAVRLQLHDPDEAHPAKRYTIPSGDVLVADVPRGPSLRSYGEKSVGCTLLIASYIYSECIGHSPYLYIE